MELGIMYNLFDGVEILKHSARTIREEADYIVIVDQEVSNHGNVLSSDMMDDKRRILDTLKKEGIIDDIIKYSPNLKLHVKKNEQIKHQIGYDRCLDVGCSHIISMDADEFYNPIELKKVKKIFEESDSDVSVCGIYEYFGNFNYCFGKTGTHVPFILKLKPSRKYERTKMEEYKIDPSRQSTFDDILYFDSDLITMHHMKFVRNNFNSIRLKLTNSGARWGITDKDIEYIVNYYKYWESRDKQKGLVVKYGDKNKYIKGEEKLYYVNNDWIK